MKNRFDFRRFVQVLRLSWQTQPVLPYIVLIAAIPIMYLYFTLDVQYYASIMKKQNTLVQAFLLYFHGCGWLYAGLSYQELGKQGAATRYLLLPASTFEKWLSKTLLVLFVFPLICWLTFNLALKGFEFLSLRWFTFRYESFDWSDRDALVAFFFFYLSVTGAYASGLIWRRFGIFKGLVSGFVLFLVLVMIFTMGQQVYPYNSGKGMLLQEVKLPFMELDSPPSVQALVHIYWPLVAYIPALLLLGSTYFFIKEKEL